METLKIKSYLRAATLKDIFFAGDIIENKEVFYKSVKTNAFEGPFLLNANKSMVELLVEFELGMLYVLDSVNITDISIAFKLMLKKAEIHDIKDAYKEYKYNVIFYILNDKKQIQGPFYISDNTNLTQLKKDLSNNQLYVVKSQKSIELLTLKKTA